MRKTNLGVVVTLVAVLAVMAFAAYKRPASAIYSSNGRSTPAPDFKLTDLNGHDVRLYDFRGKAVVLNLLGDLVSPLP